MIRPYRDDDLDDVLRIWEEASAVGHPFLSDDFVRSERENIIRMYLPNAETWVWESDGRVGGFIALIDDEIGGLFVDPALHRSGIGRALVGHARDLRDGLEVEVFEENTLARAFYASCGFVEASEGVHPETGMGIVRMRSGKAEGS